MRSSAEKAMRTALAALTVALALSLCAAVVVLLREGMLRREALQSASEPLFTREGVAGALRWIAPLAVLWFVDAVAVRCVVGSAKDVPARGKYTHPARRFPRAAAVLLAAAVVLIVMGIINGGLRDVLAKATNICTECIGLG